MLVDAIRAEGFRLSKNRTVVFWSLLFVPIAWLVLLIGNIAWTKATEPKLAQLAINFDASGSPLNIGTALLDAANILDNPGVMLFAMIAAAIVYAGDYRWETWRLITARNTRPNLLVAKLIAIAGGVAATMLLFLIANLIGALVQAAVFSRPLEFGWTGAEFGRFTSLFGLAWLRVMQFSMLALAAAVLTRSLLAALFLPLVVGAAQLALPPLLAIRGISPDSWATQLVAPGEAINALKALMSDVPVPVGVADDLALKAWVSLALWTLLPLAGALAWFRRQDLSKE